MKKFFVDTFRFIGALLALVRGIMVLGMFAVGALTVYLINVTAHVTINQYNESLTWKNTAYETPLADIEPALVANVVDTDIVNAAAAWERLDGYVDGLDGQPMQDRDAAEEVLGQARHWQEVYGLKSGAVDRLSLYLELEDAIPGAYAALDTVPLQVLAGRLHDMEMEESTVAGQQYMERLRDVSADFGEARRLMEDTVWSVGTVDNGVWTIPYTYTRTDLAEVLDQIQGMRKFPALCDVADVLSDIADVLNQNKNAREYFAYQAFWDSVSGLTRSQYVPVSSIYTYGQALSFGCIVQPVQFEGYTVSLDSPVSDVYYQGERLDNNQYMRKGAVFAADIDEIYEPVPIEVPEIPMGGEDYE